MGCCRGGALLSDRKDATLAEAHSVRRVDPLGVLESEDRPLTRDDSSCEGDAFIGSSHVAFTEFTGDV